VVDVKLNLRRGTQLLLAALPEEPYSYHWIGGKTFSVPSWKPFVIIGN